MKVLMAVDGSRYARAAARFLTHELRPHGASVDLVTAGSGPPGKPKGRQSNRQSLDERWRTVASRWQNNVAKPLESHGYRVERIVERGQPARVLPALAATGQYDLVVSGARGRGETPFFDVGSVARALLEHAPSPLLMVRERDPRNREKQSHTSRAPFRIVIPTDGKPHSTHAARWFLSRFRTENAELELVTAAEAAMAEVLAALPTQERSRIRAEAESEAHKRLRTLESQLGSGVPPTSTRLLEGRAAEEVTSHAQASGSDLIVLGSRGGEDVPERRMGSVALEIARSAPCSVLVVRESAPLST